MAKRKARCRSSANIFTIIMSTTSIYKNALVGIILFGGLTHSAFSQRTEVLRKIPLSGSMSLLIKLTTRPLPSSGGIVVQMLPGATPTKLSGVEETYTVALQRGVNEVELDKIVLNSVQGVMNGVRPRFAVYDAGARRE